MRTNLFNFTENSKPILFDVGTRSLRIGKGMGADDMVQVIEQRPSILNDCCGITPEFIMKLVLRLPK